MLVSAAALTAPAPAIAGGGLSIDKAKQVAKKYAAEICAADSPRCKSYSVGTCARLGPKKVRCKSTLNRKQGHKCTYKLTLTKADGDIRGKVGKITCT